MTTTPTALADALSISPKTLRQWLRDHKTWGRFAPGQGGEWVITLPMVVDATRRFS